MPMTDKYYRGKRLESKVFKVNEEITLPPGSEVIVTEKDTSHPDEVIFYYVTNTIQELLD